jgi:hypothetical protein
MIYLGEHERASVRVKKKLAVLILMVPPFDGKR